MNGSWQIVPDENEEDDPRSSWPADLRRLGGLALAALIVAASTALILDRSQSVGLRQTTAGTTPTHSRGPLSTPRPAAAGPGTYSLVNPCIDGNFTHGSATAGCSGYKRIVLTLPAGWTIVDGLAYKHLHQPNEVAISAWTVLEVYDDPCHWQGSALSPLDLAHETMTADRVFIPLPYTGGLANQLPRDAEPRALTQVTFSALDDLGQRWPTYAVRIVLSVPDRLDITSCDKGEVRRWPEWSIGDSPNNSAPGQIDVVYMVAVDRWPLVIEASHRPAASAADLAELDAILVSMIIDR